MMGNSVQKNLLSKTPSPKHFKKAIAFLKCFGLGDDELESGFFFLRHRYCHSCNFTPVSLHIFVIFLDFTEKQITFKLGGRTGLVHLESRTPFWLNQANKRRREAHYSSSNKTPADTGPKFPLKTQLIYSRV